MQPSYDLAQAPCEALVLAHYASPLKEAEVWFGTQAGLGSNLDSIA